MFEYEKQLMEKPLKCYANTQMTKVSCLPMSKYGWRWSSTQVIEKRKKRNRDGILKGRKDR